MKRKVYKSVLMLAVAGLLGMNAAFPAGAADVRGPIGGCSYCGYSGVTATTTYSAWQSNGSVWHGDHKDTKYIRYRYINTYCPNCGRTEKEAVGSESKTTCPL